MEMDFNIYRYDVSMKTHDSPAKSFIMVCRVFNSDGKTSEAYITSLRLARLSGQLGGWETI
jgi:hypothetical protein